MSEAQYLPILVAEARRQGVDPALAAALIKSESGWRADAKSPVGASGLGQLMPATARGLGVKNVWNPAENIRGTVTYLKNQLAAFGGNVTKALAAYNAGPGAVRKYNGVPPYRETQLYVAKVTASQRDYQKKIASVAGSVGTGAATGATAKPTKAFSRPLLEIMVHDAGSGNHLHVAGTSDPGQKKDSAQKRAIESELKKRGLRVTSGNRSRARNSAVGGVANSNHIFEASDPSTWDTWALDAVGSAQAMQAAAAWLRSSGATVGAGDTASGAAAAGVDTSAGGSAAGSGSGVIDTIKSAVENAFEFGTFAVVLLAGLSVGAALIVYGAIKATGNEQAVKSAAGTAAGVAVMRGAGGKGGG